MQGTKELKGSLVRMVVIQGKTTEIETIKVDLFWIMTILVKDICEMPYEI